MALAALSSMAPNNSLASGAANYVMADPGPAYIAYTRDGGSLGIKNLSPRNGS